MSRFNENEYLIEMLRSTSVPTHFLSEFLRNSRRTIILFYPSSSPSLSSCNSTLFLNIKSSFIILRILCYQIFPTKLASSIIFQRDEASNPEKEKKERKIIKQFAKEKKKINRASVVFPRNNNPVRIHCCA